MLLIGAIVFAIALVWTWHSSLAARELANIAAKNACAKSGVQFLDGTVAFSKLTLVRPIRMPPSLMRTYVFDYSDDGERRRQGFVVVTRRRIEAVVAISAGDKD